MAIAYLPDGESEGSVAKIKRRFETVAHGVGQAVVVLGAALAVLGPLSFALTRWSYVQFYDSFGLSPEDVGLTSARMLSIGVAGFGFAIGAWAVQWAVVFGAAGVATAFIAGTREPTGPRRGSALVGSVLAGLALVLAGGVYATHFADAHELSRSDAIALGLIVIGPPAVAVMLGAIGHPKAIELRTRLGTSQSRSRTAWAAAVLTMLFAVSTAAAGAATTGEEVAAEVKLGHSTQNPTLPLPADADPVPAFDIQADVADVEWLDDPSRAAKTGCLIYLGSGDGVVNLWSVSEQALLRVPQSRIVIKTAGDKDCASLAERTSTP